MEEQKWLLEICEIRKKLFPDERKYKEKSTDWQ